jgi:hypothetical protein
LTLVPIFAQGEPAKAKQEPKKKVVVDDDDGW